MRYDGMVERSSLLGCDRRDLIEFLRDRLSDVEINVLSWLDREPLPFYILIIIHTRYIFSLSKLEIVAELGFFLEGGGKGMSELNDGFGGSPMERGKLTF
jgi:hypothetical protein